jgi:hypothetical protein
MTVTLLADGVPAPRSMRPTDVAGSAPAALREDHEAPASVEVQMSPGLEAVPKPGSGGSEAALVAYTPLAAQRLTPPTWPV